jgi:hypothetical protein
MAAHKDNEEAGKAGSEQWELYRDLRGHNERRARLVHLLEARRRQQIERITQVARHRRFGKQG